MDKNKQSLILLCFLVPAAVFVLLPNFKGKAVKSPPASSFPLKTANDFDKKILMGLLMNDDHVQKIPVNSPWGVRNPFDITPLSVLPPEPSPEVVPVRDLVLTGVLWSGSRPSAIINDRVIGIGEKVEGLTVKEISEGRVILRDGDKETVLMMRQ